MQAHRTCVWMSPRQYPSVSAASALGAAIAADLEALRNDVDGAQELAAVYQRQLAGKSNELADLKQIFERTQHDFQALQKSIAELREERHRLANEAMRGMAFESKLREVTQERDSLRYEVLELRRRLNTETHENRYSRGVPEDNPPSPSRAGEVVPPTPEAPQTDHLPHKVIEMDFGNRT